jgi:hypothetical protein
MKNIEKIELSDELYDFIERRARAAGRSPAEEIADVVARNAAAEAREAALLEQLRQDHEEQERAGIFLTDDDIISATEWGRE